MGNLSGYTTIESKFVFMTLMFGDFSGPPMVIVEGEDIPEDVDGIVDTLNYLGSVGWKVNSAVALTIADEPACSIIMDAIS